MAVTHVGTVGNAASPSVFKELLFFFFFSPQQKHIVHDPGENWRQSLGKESEGRLKDIFPA